mgnify:FL=1
MSGVELEVIWLNPWLILGGLYAWDRLNRNSREAKENARRLAELEKTVHGEQQDKQPQ